MSVSSVYWIRCADHTDMTSQGYIGVTGRFDRRMWEHYTLEGNRHLKFAIQKYGWDNLVKTQILIADEGYCLDIERKLRPNDGIGWNCTTGGGMPPKGKWTLGKKGLSVAWNKGLPWSDEFKENIRVKVSKLWENPEYREHMSKAHKGQTSSMKGKKHSPESLKKMSEVKLGKPSLLKNRPISEEHKLKVKSTMESQRWICPHCQKTGKGVHTANRWHFNNCKEKVLCL